MASTDARPVPRKNVAFRVTFPIMDADGDLVTGATGLDSEVSIDGGTFADATSEATEIATSSGVYFLDLTAGEMNGDTVAVIVKTTSVGAKTTVLVMYPEEAGDYRADVVAVNAQTDVDGVSGNIIGALRVMMSALAGKVSGMATNAPVFRDAADSKNRITATTDDDGNRSAVTRDGT